MFLRTHVRYKYTTYGALRPTLIQNCTNTRRTPFRRVVYALYHAVRRRNRLERLTGAGAHFALAARTDSPQRAGSALEALCRLEELVGRRGGGKLQVADRSGCRALPRRQPTRRADPRRDRREGRSRQMFRRGGYKMAVNSRRGTTTGKPS